MKKGRGNHFHSLLFTLFFWLNPLIFPGKLWKKRDDKGKIENRVQSNQCLNKNLYDTTVFLYIKKSAYCLSVSILNRIV